ncbi:MAG TPA: zinc ribbon domain-containing protein [Dehalococcoidia bacterium]
MSREPRRVFSARLDTFLGQLDEGETPNHGRFCSFCYNPLPPDYQRCDHCGQDLHDRPPITSLPPPVIAMHERRQRLESIVVNSFAYLGLALALTAFLGMVAFNVLYLDRVLWFYFIAVGVLLIGARVFPAIIGGVIGDEIGYSYANRRLSEDWARHVAERENGRAPGAIGGPETAH